MIYICLCSFISWFLGFCLSFFLSAKRLTPHISNIQITTLKSKILHHIVAPLYKNQFVSLLSFSLQVPAAKADTAVTYAVYSYACPVKKVVCAKDQQNEYLRTKPRSGTVPETSGSHLTYPLCERSCVAWLCFSVTAQLWCRICLSGGKISHSQGANYRCKKGMVR